MLGITNPDKFRSDDEISVVPTDVSNTSGSQLRYIDVVPSAGLKLNGSVNGMLLIEMPLGASSTMIKFILSIYLYSGNHTNQDSCDLSLGGYMFTTNTWHNTAASKMNSGVSSTPYRVRFGYISTTGNSCIVVDKNDSNSVWSIPQFLVRNLQIAHGANVDSPLWTQWPNMRIITDVLAENIVIQANQPPLIPADIGNP